MPYGLEFGGVGVESLRVQGFWAVGDPGMRRRLVMEPVSCGHRQRRPGRLPDATRW